MAERPGRVDIPCPACGEWVVVWIDRADLEVDRPRGGLLGGLTVSGPHYCVESTKPAKASPDASAPE